MIKVVLVGCGAMSAVWLDAIVNSPDLKLVGLVDIDLARAQSSAEKYGLSEISVGTNLEAILLSSRPDAVFDVVVPQARKDVVLTAMQHGCHVLTEKPMAATMQDARAIIDAAQKFGKIHAVVQNRRYIANVRRIRRFLDSGTLGPVTSVHCDFFIAPHFGGFREEMDHVLLVDMAIHTFDAARYMINAAPQQVFCQEWEAANTWFKQGSSAVATFTFENGAVFNYRGSWCADGMKTSWESSWRFICERGTLVWDGFEGLDAQRKTLVRDGLFDQTEDLDVPLLHSNDRVGGHKGVIADFVEALTRNKAPETAGTDNIKSLAMVFGAVESAERGQRVEITA